MPRFVSAHSMISIGLHSKGWFLLFICSMLGFGHGEATNFSFIGFGEKNVQQQTSCFSGASFVDESMQLTASGAVQGMGRCLYNQAIQFLDANGKPRSFSTQFIFEIDPGANDLADGVAFVIAPFLGPVNGSNQGFLGLFNNETDGKSSTHTFAVEFDTYKNPEYNDTDDNHVGIDINSIFSNYSIHAAVRTSSSPVIYSSSDGYVVEMKGAPVQAWIDYDAGTNRLNVSVTRAIGIKPNYSLISDSFDLAGVLREQMYVGFTASTGSLNDVLYYVYAWSFNDEGFSAPVSMPDENSSSKLKIGLIIGFVVCTVLVVFAVTTFAYLKKRTRRKNEVIIDGDLQISLNDHLPQKFSYRELSKATQNFNELNRLGAGGFGTVYKGTLPSNSVSIAVKRVSKESKQGVREFVSEVTTIGQLRHRNLVPLLGWCHEKGFLLVYELMPNGSLDYMLFEGDQEISWQKRLHILRGIAAALLYLHDECEKKIVHRDIKASNVMLDADMNARLGDFGLARLYGHDVAPDSTNVAGTWGYMAPESFLTRKATDKTDVYSYGALVLEVVSRKKVSQSSGQEGCSLIEWVWVLHKRNSILDAIDPALELNTVEDKQMVKGALELGLLCCSHDPNGRPSMRYILQVLNGDAPPPPLPASIGSRFLSTDTQSTSSSLDSLLYSSNTFASQSFTG